MRKHTMIFEEFDVNQFMENPEAEFAKNADSPEIEEGDYVESYRGKGQVIELNGDFAKIQLAGSAGTIVKVPRFSLKKTGAPASSKPTVDSHPELQEMAEAMTEYLGFLEEDPKAINLRAAEELLQTMLVDIINLQKQDPSVAQTKEFDVIWHGAVNLGSKMVDVSPGLKDEVDVILSKFEDMENIR